MAFALIRLISLLRLPLPSSPLPEESLTTQNDIAMAWAAAQSRPSITTHGWAAQARPRNREKPSSRPAAAPGRSRRLLRHGLFPLCVGNMEAPSSNLHPILRLCYQASVHLPGLSVPSRPAALGRVPSSGRHGAVPSIITGSLPAHRLRPGSSGFPSKTPAKAAIVC